MNKKLKVGIVGGTGMVGQRFITLLENHPFFELKVIAASARSAGQTYEKAVEGRWKMSTPMPESVKNMMVMDASKVEEVASQVDWLNWLAYGQTFGIQDPFVLNLNVLSLTFAFSLHINIASIIGLAIAVFLYKKIY